MFDVVVSEEPSHEVEITENPVEVGVSMADHAFKKPVEIEIEVMVSDAPLLSDGNGTPSYQLASTQYPLAKRWQSGDSERRSVNAWAYLRRKQDEFAVFDVQTGLELYQNVMIKKLRAKQDAETSSVLSAEMTLHQVTFATTQTVIYPPRGPAKTKRTAAPKKDDGHKDAQSELTESQAQSVLKGLTDRLGITK